MAHLSRTHSNINRTLKLRLKHVGSRPAGLERPRLAFLLWPLFCHARTQAHPTYVTCMCPGFPDRVVSRAAACNCGL